MYLLIFFTSQNVWKCLLTTIAYVKLRFFINFLRALRSRVHNGFCSYLFTDDIICTNALLLNLVCDLFNWSGVFSKERYVSVIKTRHVAITWWDCPCSALNALFIYKRVWKVEWAPHRLPQSHHQHHFRIRFLRLLFSIPFRVDRWLTVVPYHISSVNMNSTTLTIFSFFVLYHLFLQKRASINAVPKEQLSRVVYVQFFSNFCSILRCISTNVFYWLSFEKRCTQIAHEVWQKHLHWAISFSNYLHLRILSHPITMHYLALPVWKTPNAVIYI